MVEAKFDELGNKLVNEVGNITFKCPNCGDFEISRTRKARELSKEYVCQKCVLLDHNFEFFFYF